MAKIRLNSYHRQALRHFAGTNVECRAEQKARDKAYAKAEKLAREAVEKQFPPADMALLQKYEVARADACIQGGSPTGEHIHFEFENVETAPLCPKRSCSSRSIKFSQPAVDAIAAHTLAANALAKARNAKLSQYLALIEAARSFEDVVEVWPAAAALSDRIKPSTALVALSDDVREFIRSDNAGASLAQAA